MSRIILLAIFVVFIAGGRAEAAWLEYKNPELGYAILFPAQPALSTVSYKTGLVPAATTRVYSATEDSGHFSATVVDLPDRLDEGASILTEAEFNLALIGDIVLNSTSRVQGGRDATYGRLLTLDCRSGIIPDQPGQTAVAHVWFKNITGVDCPDGARMLVTMFFRQARMYLFIGINFPVDGDAIRPAAIRFVQSVIFLNPLPAAAAARAGRGGAGGGN